MNKAQLLAKLTQAVINDDSAYVLKLAEALNDLTNTGAPVATITRLTGGDDGYWVTYLGSDRVPDYVPSWHLAQGLAHAYVDAWWTAQERSAPHRMATMAPHPRNPHASPAPDRPLPLQRRVDDAHALVPTSASPKPATRPTALPSRSATAHDAVNAVSNAYPHPGHGGHPKEPPMNREQWLKAAGDLLVTEFDLHLPRPWRVSTGSPARQGKSLGHCYASAAVQDGANEIWVNASIVDPLQILGVLLHELLHAEDDCQSGHAGAFQRRALQVGYLPPAEGLPALRRAKGPPGGPAGLLPRLPHRARCSPATPKKGRMIKLQCDQPLADGSATPPNPASPSYPTTPAARRAKPVTWSPPPAPHRRRSNPTQPKEPTP